MYNGQNPPINGFNYEHFSFPDSWKGYLLKDLFSVRGGRPISRNNMGDTGIACLHYGDIHTSTDLFLDVIKQYNSLPKVKDNQYKNSDLLRDGDIVFADASEDYEGIAKSIVIENKSEKEIIAGLHTVIASSKEKEVNELFRKYMFSNWLVRKQLMFFAQGISVFGISKTNIENTVLVLPPLLEQKKIAKILSTWDDAIEINLKQILEYQKLKKALYQKIFTSVEVPRIAIRNLIKNRRKIDCNNVEENKYLEIGDIDIFNNTYQLKKKKAVKGSKIACTGSIAVSTVRPTRGAITILKNDMYVSSALTVIDLVDSVNREYIYHQLLTNRFLNKMGSLSTGSTYPTVSHDDVLSYKVLVPDMDLQDRHSKLLQSIEDYITNKLVVVEKLKMQKQGLMQQLLTGKIRVNVS